MFTDSFAAVIVASFLACAVTTVGIYVISKYERWGREHYICHEYDRGDYAVGIIPMLGIGFHSFVGCKISPRGCAAA